MEWGGCSLFLLSFFLHHTDGLVTSGPGCLPFCRTVGIACLLTYFPQSVCLEPIDLGYIVGS